MTLRLLAAAALAAAAVPAGAAVVVTNTTIRDAAFTVSNTDLNQTHLANFFGFGQFDREGEGDYPVFYDGSFGKVGSVAENGPLIGAGTANQTNSIAFVFDGLYNLSSIATYAGWDAFRGGQSYTLFVAHADGIFRRFATEYNNDFGGGDGATRAVFTSTSRYLATNVRGISFEFNGDLQYGYAGYREFDAFGTAVPEPATWALLVAGFGLVGVAARRRARTVAA